MPNTVPMKFYKTKAGVQGGWHYQLLPSVGVGKGHIEVSESEAQSEFERLTKIMSGSQAPGPQVEQKFVDTLKGDLAKYQSGESPFALDDKGVLTTKETLAKQADIQAKLASGDYINTGTAEAPLLIPKGSAGALLHQQPGDTLGQVGTTKTTSYQIQGGDTLSSLALKHGTTVDALMAANPQIKNPNLIYAGQNLNIPSKTDTTGEVDDTGGTGTTPGGDTGADGGKTPEQLAAEDAARKQEILDEIQAELDANQTGATTAVTGEGITEPIAPDYSTEYEDLRTKYGVETIENDITDIDKQIADINALYESGKAEEGQRLTSMGIIRKRQGALSTEQQIELTRLTNQKNALINQLNSKMGTIDTLMNLKGQTYDDARGAYEFGFNKAIQGQQLLNQERDDARASLIAMTNLFAGTQITWDDLEYTQQVEITKLELSSGMPVGTMQSFMSSKPNANLLATKHGYDADGNAITTFIYEDENGLPGVSYIEQTGGSKSAEIDDTKFWSEVDQAKKELRSGTPWGTVFERIKSQFDSKSNEEIDEALGKIEDMGGGKSIDWSKEGAYKSYEQAKSTEATFTEQVVTILQQWKKLGLTKKEAEKQMKEEYGVKNISSEIQDEINKIWE